MATLHTHKNTIQHFRVIVNQTNKKYNLFLQCLTSGRCIFFRGFFFGHKIMYNMIIYVRTFGKIVSLSFIA